MGVSSGTDLVPGLIVRASLTTLLFFSLMWTKAILLEGNPSRSQGATILLP